MASASDASRSFETTFEDLNYFQCKIGGGEGYLGLFKGTDTHALGVVPTGDVFSRDALDEEEKLFRYVRILRKRKVVLNDFLWFLPKATEAGFSGEEILSWLGSLYYAPSSQESTEAYTCATIRSRLDEKFKLEVYMTSDPLAQDAVDVVVVRVKKSGRFVLLGKRNTVKTTVKFSGGRGVVVVVCPGDFVLFGEHMTPAEKAALAAARAKQLATGRLYMLLDGEEGAAADRAGNEECTAGFGKSLRKLFYVGVSDAPGRDARYWEYLDSETGTVYGYKRDSRAHIVLAVLDEDPRLEIPPEDVDEMRAPSYLPEDYVLEQFCVDGKLNPVFPAHVDALKQALRALDCVVADGLVAA